MKFTSALFAAFLGSISVNAHSISFDLSDLEGQFIVLAGDFERLNCPALGKYDCMVWPMNLIKHTRKNVCLVPNRLSSCSFKCSGAVGSDDTKRLTFLQFDGMGNTVSAEASPVKQIACPSLY